MTNFIVFLCVFKSSILLVMCSLLRKFSIYDYDSFLLIVSNYRYLFPKIVFLVLFDLFIFNTMNFERLLLEFISCITYHLRSVCDIVKFDMGHSRRQLYMQISRSVFSGPLAVYCNKGSLLCLLCPIPQ